MEYERVSEKEWEEIILKSDNAYFFSSPSWAKIMEKSFDKYRTATRLYHINGKSILIPMMGKKTHGKKIYGFNSFKSMPMGPGGLFSESEITTNEFRHIVKDIIGSRHIFSLDFPPFEKPFENKASSGKSTTKIKDEWNIKNEWNYMHVLNLEGKDFEHIKNNFNRNTRKNIRKAIKSGVEIRDGTSLDDFRAYYNIYLKASQKWDSESPPHPFNLYKNFHKYGSPHVKLSLATKDNKTIAGLISLHYTKTVHYWLGVTNDDYRTFTPSSLLFRDSIKQSCQEDYKYINFGSSVGIAGLRRFKEGFGARKVETKRYLAVSNGAKILFKIKTVGKTLKNRFISK